MDVHALEYLLLIAETGSLSEAAEKAHLSQPAMTQCLAKLEREAGWPLFNRVNRKLVPTRAGQIYLKGAREMVQIKEETYQSIEQLRRQQGQLRVTGSADICYLLEEKLLPKLYLQFPQLKVERMVTTTHTAKQYLTNGLADLSFLCAVKPSSLLEYVPLLHDTLCLAVPESMISAEIRAGGLAACGCLPFVLPDEQQFGGNWWTACSGGSTCTPFPYTPPPVGRTLSGWQTRATAQRSCPNGAPPGWNIAKSSRWKMPLRSILSARFRAMLSLPPPAWP